jgi:hypothetical protein
MYYIRYISFGACVTLFNSKRNACDGFFYNHYTCHLLDTTQSLFQLVSLDPTSTLSSYRNGTLIVRKTGGGGGGAFNFNFNSNVNINSSNVTALPLSLTQAGNPFSPAEGSSGRAGKGGERKGERSVPRRQKPNSSLPREAVLQSPGQLFKACQLAGAAAEARLSREQQMARTRVFSALPRVNIVLSATRDVVDRDVVAFRRVVHHWECYAKIHSYNCTTSVLDSPSDQMDPLQFMNTSQYTLFLDANSVTLNMSRSLEPFLLQDKSILLQMQENFEISSAIYLLRNDFRAHCFLTYLQLFGRREEDPLWLLQTLGGGGAGGSGVASLHDSRAGEALGGAVLGLLPERGDACIYVQCFSF